MPDEKPQPLSGPQFIAVGENGLRCFSSDGRAWSNIQLGKDGQVYRTAAFGDGRCVVAAHFGGPVHLARDLDRF